MQGNKKHTDGQSDSSSLGSLLDETDQEVCSLTDRAFKSLCVEEPETSYAKAETAVSPRIQHPFSSKLFQGPRNHALLKNTVSSKLLPKMEARSTFQQLSKDAQGEETNSPPDIRRKLGLPVPNLHRYKHTSKVSSLIKTFDKVESQEAPAVAKQPAKNPAPKCPLICGPDMALWGSKTILNIPPELSGFSGALQHVGVAHRRHGMPLRHHPMDLLCQGTPRLYSVPEGPSNIPQPGIVAVSRKIAKNRTGKGSELAGRGSFLHSENSAFESWKAHHRKMTGMGGPAEAMPMEEYLMHLEEMPCFDECYLPDAKPPLLHMATSVVPELDFSPRALPQNSLHQISVAPVSLCRSPSLPLSITGDPLVQPLLPPPSGQAGPVHRIPTPPPLPSNAPLPRRPAPQVVASPEPTSKAPVPLPSTQQTLAPAEAETPSTAAETFALPVALLPEKTNSLEHDLEAERICPPWRRQKTVRRGIEMVVDTANAAPERKDSTPAAPSVAEMPPADFCITSSDASGQSFNITQLLTPLIPPKQEPSESPPLLATPPLSEAEATQESEERTFPSSQNNYKSRAPSLLFNLKDIRKRVKSTYSPSPLLRALEEKKKVKDQEGLKASVAGLLEGSHSKLVENDERSQKLSGEMGGTQEQARITDLKAHLQDSYQTLSSPRSQSDRLGYQNRSRLQPDISMDFENSEAVSIAELRPKERSPRQPSPPSRPERDTYLQNVSFWDPKSRKGVQHPLAEGRPPESPSPFFSADENMNDPESPACQGIGEEEQKDVKSTSSSEQSFVSIIDQPSQGETCSLMQLFQRACLQESQRNKDKGSREGKPRSKEEGKSGRPEEGLQGPGLDLEDSGLEAKHDGKMEPSEEGEKLQERLRGEMRESRGQSQDSAPEGKADEPLTPTSPSSFKPNLFTIKDNTFKSPPVIKAVKLPLFRSLSCDGAIAGASAESEKQTHGSFQAVQETDWPLSRNRRQLRPWRVEVATGREGDGSGSSAESPWQEGRGMAVSQGQLVGDEGGTAVKAGLAQKEDKDRKKQRASNKAKARVRKMRPSSTGQLNLEEDLARNQARSPTREKTNYYKNNLLPKRRSGSCTKKVITQEPGSPLAPESLAYSPASSNAFKDTPTSPTLPSPRSDSTMPAAFRSLFSDTAAPCNAAKAEKAPPSSSWHGGDPPPMAETPAPMQAGQVSGPADDFPVTGERPQLMRQMVKTAAKPPAVPPKTEKALRRAKKLASRRNKADAQQKRPPAETRPPCEDSAPAPPAPSPHLPTHLSSPATPSESHHVASQRGPSTPAPSSPSIQRKLLQDPSSGEYFFVELPVQLKTLYDPESGRYIQVSLPSKRHLSQMPSPEVLAPPYVLYPSSLPLRVSSVPAQASPSQLSEPASLVQGALSEFGADWPQEGLYPDPRNRQPYFESSVSEVHTQETDGPAFKFERGAGLSDQADIVSIGGTEDFALEGIS